MVLILISKRLSQQIRPSIDTLQVTMFYNDRQQFCFKPRTESTLVVTRLPLCSCEVLSQVWKQSPVSDPPLEGVLFFLGAVLRKLCPHRLCASTRGKAKSQHLNWLFRMTHATAARTVQCKAVSFTLRKGTLSGPLLIAAVLPSHPTSVSSRPHPWGTHWAWTVDLWALRAVSWHEWLKGEKFGSSNWLDHFG